MKLGPGWQLEDGVPWYHLKSGKRRYRGVWRTCQFCGEDFPAPPTNPGLYCSRSCRGKVCGGSMRSTRPDLFEHWTPEECWLAGLIWSDGHLGQDHGSNRRITLKLTDEDALAAAASIAGRSYRSTPSLPPRKTVHTLQFGERNAVNRVASAGMDHPKLTTRPWPNLPYPGAFLRGVFDGDGCVCRYAQKLVPGWPERLQTTLFGGALFIAGAREFLAHRGIRRGTIHSKTRIQTLYYLTWAHNDSLRLAEVMYSEPGPRLERKWAKFQAPFTETALGMPRQPRRPVKNA